MALKYLIKSWLIMLKSCLIIVIGANNADVMTS